MRQVDHVYVDAIPRTPAPDTLYISGKYEVAVHLCLCGCGTRVVTPLGASEWSVTERGGRITLRPSIGNGALDCRSHYLITNGSAQWLPPQSPAEYERAFARDRRDREAEIARRRPWWRRALSWLSGRVSGHD